MHVSRALNPEWKIQISDAPVVCKVMARVLGRTSGRGCCAVFITLTVPL